jgi:MFS family permease
LRLAWLVWGLGALLYLIGFYQRVAPAVITGELMTEFALNAAALGQLSALYFYSYVAMQVPTGILADHWGPRRLLSAGAAAAAVGTLLFALSPTYFWSGAGRLLVGASVAVAFVGMLKLASHWLPERHFSLASGLALFTGVVGAVTAGVPLRLLVDAFGWRPVMTVSGLVTALLAMAIWWVVRDDPVQRGYASHAAEHPDDTQAPDGIWAGLKRVIGYRNIRLLFLVPGGLVGSILTFAGLWGVPYLTTHYDLPTTRAAALTSLMLVAWAFGGPVFGALSDRIGLRKPLYLGGMIVAAIGWAVLIFVQTLPMPALIALLTGIGFASGSMIIGFAFAKESVPGRLAGTASGIANMGVMIGPMLLQPAVGVVLDRFWDGTVVDGVRLYGVEAYRTGFALMLAWVVFSIVMLALTAETGKRALKAG